MLDSMYSYFDIHTHHTKVNKEVLVIRSLRFAEWDQLFMQHSCSVGIHPWDLPLPHSLEEGLKTLERVAHHSQVKMIGEAGIDRSIQHPLFLQKECFEKQIQLSEQLEKPLLIHCVRCFDELLLLKRKYKPRQSWILHGYRKSSKLACQLQDQGILLSFGEALFDTRSQASASLVEVGQRPFFLETDRSTKSIEEVYRKAAELLSCELEELCSWQENYKTQVFGRDFSSVVFEIDEGKT